MFTAVQWIVSTTVLYFQDGLKKRMERLKKSIEEATKAVEAEKKKNVALLELIFPADIARKLWLGMQDLRVGYM